VLRRADASLRSPPEVWVVSHVLGSLPLGKLFWGCPGLSGWQNVAHRGRGTLGAWGVLLGCERRTPCLMCSPTQAGRSAKRQLFLLPGGIERHLKIKTCSVSEGTRWLRAPRAHGH